MCTKCPFREYFEKNVGSNEILELLLGFTGSTRRFAAEVNQKADFRLRTEPSIFDMLKQKGK